VTDEQQSQPSAPGSLRERLGPGAVVGHVKLPISVRQSIAPTAGSIIGAGVGTAAAPFTAGILNPWTGAMIGGAAGELVNQYTPGFNEYTQSPKDPVAVAVSGLAGALPVAGRAIGRTVPPAVNAAAGAIGKVPVAVSSGLGAGAGLILDLLTAGMGLGTMTGAALAQGPRLLARALTTGAGRATVQGLVGATGEQAAQAAAQVARNAILGTTTTDLERQREITRQRRMR
jgi:hypothetical protein